MNPCVAAKRIANSLQSQRLGALRGVTLLSDAGAAVVFGNDDYAHDPETREEVRLILDRAAQDQVEVLGFETDDAGHSAWALVLRSTDLDWLRTRLREASYESHCDKASERRLIVAEVVNSTDAPIGEVDGVQTLELVSKIEASKIEASEIEASKIEACDEDACLVEGEDRSLLPRPL
jgi:hypothetical protein